MCQGMWVVGGCDVGVRMVCAYRCTCCVCVCVCVCVVCVWRGKEGWRKINSSKQYLRHTLAMFGGKLSNSAWLFYYTRKDLKA